MAGLAVEVIFSGVQVCASADNPTLMVEFRVVKTLDCERHVWRIDPIQDIITDEQLFHANKLHILISLLISFNVSILLPRLRKVES